MPEPPPPPLASPQFGVVPVATNSVSTLLFAAPTPVTSKPEPVFVILYFLPTTSVPLVIFLKETSNFRGMLTNAGRVFAYPPRIVTLPANDAWLRDRRFGERPASTPRSSVRNPSLMRWRSITGIKQRRRNQMLRQPPLLASAPLVVSC